VKQLNHILISNVYEYNNRVMYYVYIFGIYQFDCPQK